MQARDKEVYDRQSDAWYYFDANGEMLKNTNKDLPGKTVRYDENGHMVKGEKRIGNDDYYFDMQTGAEPMSVPSGWCGLSVPSVPSLSVPVAPAC